ncbi:MAG: Hsp70 family protein [Planctomycetaceae bacterium]|jgi:molecular chaperone DnaK|nr:Hsp70 family protein [Planctomycetaceae bacterium]
MSKKNVLAIDFGTSRTKVAYFDELQNKPVLIEIGRNIRAMIPSAFYVPLPVDGKVVASEILVGDEAENMLDKDPDGYITSTKNEIHETDLKRLNGNREVDRIELVGAIFRYINDYVKSNVPYFADVEIDSCVLTVPASFSTTQREAICKAAELGNFRNVKIIEEPVAAATMWFAKKHEVKVDVEYLVVCDIGGGSTNFATVELRNGIFQLVQEIPTKCSNIGGDNLDDRIIARLKNTTDNNNRQNFEQSIYRSRYWR